jgi:hypothetical protein
LNEALKLELEEVQTTLYRYVKCKKKKKLKLKNNGFTEITVISQDVSEGTFAHILLYIATKIRFVR